MAGIEDPTTVDLVTQTPDHEVRLIMVESRPWHSDPAQRRQLLDKINAYSTYARGGQLLRDYPDTVGHRVVVQIDCQGQPTGDIAELIDVARRGFEEHGMGLVVTVMDAQP